MQRTASTTAKFKASVQQRTSGLELRTPLSTPSPDPLLVDDITSNNPLSTRPGTRCHSTSPGSYPTLSPLHLHPLPPIHPRITYFAEARIRPGATNLTAPPHVGPDLTPGIPPGNAPNPKPPHPLLHKVKVRNPVKDPGLISDRFTNSHRCRPIPCLHGQWHKIRHKIIFILMSK